MDDGRQPGAPAPGCAPSFLDCACAKEDLGCSICLETLQDPFVTTCGHTFCYRCLEQHLAHQHNCPACARFLTPDLIYPNFLLSKIAKRAHSRALSAAPSARELLTQAVSDLRVGLSEADTDALLAQLGEHKRALQEVQREASMELLMHFLQSSREEKVRRLAQLQKELSCLDGDIQRVEAVGAGQSQAQPQQQQPKAGAGEPAPAAAEAEQQQQQQQDGVQAMQAEQPQAAQDAAQQQQQEAAAAALGDSVLQSQQLFQQQRAAQEQAAAAAADGGSTAGAAAQPPPPQQQQHPQQQHAVHASPGVLSLLGSPGMAQMTTSSGGSAGRAGGVLSLLRNKKRRIASQFEDLQQCYLRLRADQLEQAGGGGSGGGGRGLDAQVPVSVAAAAMAAAEAAEDAAVAAVAAASEGAAAGRGTPPVGPLIDEGLQEFSRLLSVITRCNKLRPVVEVPRPSPRPGASSIISSLEFDREGALFAAAGVSKRISIFDYASVVPPPGGGPGVRCPAVELVSRSKLSCLSWSRYVQAHIASSDYEGVVSVWDVSAAAPLHEYEAHSKRIWSVDYCEADPALLASGSDDCTVKLWSTRTPSSVAQIDTKANVCAVRWRPSSSHELAVGSADHSAYLYDVRHTAMPLRTFQGHRKAVSYVRFCSPGELVTASTDSTLRLWGVEGEARAAPGASPAAQRVYEGHSNEKNFVGLAVDGDFLACGSETCDLHVYYKALSKPVAQQAFAGGGADDSSAVGGRRGHHGEEAHSSDKAFISAVCWRPGAHTLLAANSQGTIKVFQLTGSGHAV